MIKIFRASLAKEFSGQGPSSVGGGRKCRGGGSGVRLPPVRQLQGSGAQLKFKDMLYSDEDAKKRPSDLEIKQKDLPKNTPTLEERIRRDHASPLLVLDRKSGYFKGPTGTIRDYIDPNLTTRQVLTEGFREFKKEVKKWRRELATEEQRQWIRPGQKRLEWSFDTDEARDDWILTADSTWGEGYSKACLSKTESGKTVVFHGDLSTRVPLDGRTKRAGYVNMKAVQKRASFYRVQPLGWEKFTHLCFRLRGDGRTYYINLHLDNYYDLEWNDMYRFPLYTRGGPYWQYTEIPFSKFYFAHKGYIQDDQSLVPLRKVVSIGITLSDNYDGPFHLELDRIEVMQNYNRHSHHDSSPYETYRFPRINFNRP